MTRFYLPFWLSISTLMLLFCIGVWFAGHAQPLHPMLRGFIEGCEGHPNSCWYSIVPGVTTRARAEMILLLHGFSPQQEDQFLIWQRDGWGTVNLVVNRTNGQLWGLNLRPVGFITMADALGVLPDYPTHVGRTCDNTYSLPMGTLMMTAYGTTPTSEVRSFELATFGLGGNLLFPHNRWRGFWHRYHITGGAGCG